MWLRRANARCRGIAAARILERRRSTQRPSLAFVATLTNNARTQSSFHEQASVFQQRPRRSFATAAPAAPPKTAVTLTSDAKKYSRDPKLLNLSNGRTIAFDQFGAADGEPVFFLHSGPGSRIAGAAFHNSASRAGVRLLCVDRPGIGATSPMSTLRTLRTSCDDIAIVADALHIQSFGVVGWATGGAFALAAAAALPNRVRFVHTLASIGPPRDLPVDTFALLAPADRRATR
jgi:hypothetical protein